MAFVFHLLSIVLYAAVGIVTAVWLPAQFPAVDSGLAYAFGAIAVLGLTLFHTLITAVLAHFGMARRMCRVEEALDVTRAHLEQNRQDQKHKPAAAPAFTHDKRVDEVMAEMQVLQSLVARLTANVQNQAALPLEKGMQIAASHEEADDTVAEAPMELTERVITVAPPEPANEDLGTSTDRVAEPSSGVPSNRRELPPVADGLTAPQIMAIVKEGLKRDRVDLVLQPIVGLPQRKHRYYECFSRIHDGAGRIVMPDQYLSIARNSGLIAPIDNMLLFRCVQLVRRVQRSQSDYGFFCNISSHSLKDTPFFSDFITFMSDNTDLSANLVFELAQSDVASMTDEIAQNLYRLAELGFDFSIDQVQDLQMDYAELARHRFRFVKVQAADLVSLIGVHPPELNLRSLKSTMNGLGIDLVAEKIEDEATLVELLEYNIDLGQGYLFGEPRLSRAA